MNISISPGKLLGSIRVLPSKSQAHRLLICAAFADKPTTLLCPQTNDDIDATAGCLCALGASVVRTEDGFHITPAFHIPDNALLDCRESGSTLRFLLPIAGALGVDATFRMSGRLPQRPMSPLWEEMERMGCRLSRPTADTIYCQGQLSPGAYCIDGGISSQFITGLLLAFSLCKSESSLTITGKTESRPYIDMTRQVLSLFGADPDRPGLRSLRSPGTVAVEGDWSNGAFFLAAKQLGSELEVNGLSASSSQGDKAIARILPSLRNCHQTISAADIPDLIPILAVVAACSHGARFTDIGRLRLKESDRVSTVVEMITALGGEAEDLGDHMMVWATPLMGGTVNSHNDHRIAMSAAIAATVCQNNVTILGAEAVNKSYPTFWEEYRRLRGNYEFLLW